MDNARPATYPQVIKRLLLEETIKQLNGQIFSVDFTKKDDTNRHMVCRISVRKHVKGTRPIATAARKNTLAYNGMLTVYEMKGKTSQYRTINLNTVKKFKCGNKELVGFNS